MPKSPAAKPKAMPTPKGKGLLKRWFPKHYVRARVFLIIVIVLVVARIALPYIVLYVVNDRLAKVPGYYGHVEDVDIAILRGAYVLDDIYLDHVDSLTQERTPFLSAHKVDLSVEWGALFKGKIVGEVEADKFSVIFTKDKMEPQQIKEDKNILVDLGNDFMPLRLNRVELRNSNVHYKDLTSSPKLDMEMTEVYLLAQNLRTEKDSALLPSTVIARASLFGGTLLMGTKMDLLATDPTFDINAQVTEVDLVKLNDFFKAYAKLDVNKGNFAMYMEAASKEGALKGYVKPIIKHLDVLGREDRDDGLLQKFWEGLMGTAGFVLTNQKYDQIATKVVFEGTLKKAETNIWFSIYEVLKNAFVQALRSSIDNSVSIATVETVDEKKGLKDLFTKGDKNNKKVASNKDSKSQKESKSSKKRDERKAARKKKQAEKGKTK